MHSGHTFSVAFFFFLRVQSTALIFNYDSEKAIYFCGMGSSKWMGLEKKKDTVVGFVVSDKA